MSSGFRRRRDEGPSDDERRAAIHLPAEIPDLDAARLREIIAAILVHATGTAWAASHPAAARLPAGSTDPAPLVTVRCTPATRAAGEPADVYETTISLPYNAVVDMTQVGQLVTMAPGRLSNIEGMNSVGEAGQGLRSVVRFRLHSLARPAPGYQTHATRMLVTYQAVRDAAQGEAVELVWGSATQ